MGDLAIGVVGLMAYRFRGHFWLATIVVLTISTSETRASHIYYWGGEQHQPTTSASLWTDILLPIVMWSSMRGRGTTTATRCQVSLSHRSSPAIPARCRPTGSTISPSSSVRAKTYARSRSWAVAPASDAPRHSL